MYGRTADPRLLLLRVTNRTADLNAVRTRMLDVKYGSLECWK